MFRLCDQPLESTALRRAVSNPASGAFVCFEGTVRNHHRGRRVLRLAYEAHSAVAEKEGSRIVAEAKSRFGLHSAAAVHRIGMLEVQDPAVLVIAASPHRGEAFEACRFLIDEIKNRVPIWKREFYEDGSAEWVGCEGCTRHAGSSEAE